MPKVIRKTKPVKRTAGLKSTKRSSRLRSESYDLLLEAVEGLRDYGIFMLDPTGHVLTWNKGAERMKGYRKHEIVGKHFSLFYSEEDRARKHPEWELKEAKKIGRYEEEGWRVRKNGSRFWVNVVITKLINKSGQLAGFSKVTKDLTARKTFEDKIRQSEERFRLLVDGVRDHAIFMLDPDGLVASWNPGAERILGFPAKEVLGKALELFSAEELAEARRSGRFESEGWRLRRGGKRFWASVGITAVRDKAERLVGFAMVTRDLSEKKRAEDELQRAYADLERRVEERTAELALANMKLGENEASLRAAVEVRDEFISIASHELKTPITSLKIQMQMLQARTKPKDGIMPTPDKLERFLGGSLKQVDRLTHLVEELLDVARAQSQKLSFQFETTDLSILGADVIERLKEQFEIAGCALSFESQGPVVGSFDRFRIDQVLVNLLTNATKYAPGKMIHLIIGQRKGRATLTVRDEGPGIPLEIQSRLFERFERGANARNLGGLGLGLFITREIVQGHQGSIRVESKPGRGAAFHVELPLNPTS